MDNLDRRTFLKNFLLATGALTLSPSGFLAYENEITDVRPFEMLAIGDSVMWGQGLCEDEKFSYRIKNWLEKDVFNKKRSVNLQVKAHSGATIETKQKPEKGFDPLKYYDGEINIWSPSIMQQADDAYKCYSEPTADADKCHTLPTDDAHKCYSQPTLSPDNCCFSKSANLSYYKGKPVTPENLDLILVDGGINDLNKALLVTPSLNHNKIVAAAKRYCDGSMTKLLSKLAGQFPNAKIIVTGYFPLISIKTPSTEVYKAIIQAFGANSFTNGILKILKRLTFAENAKLHPILKLLAKRSNVWYEKSDEYLQNAVDNVNKSHPIKLSSGETTDRAFFVNVVFGKDNEHAYGTKDTFLWELIDETRTDDSRFKDRKQICYDPKLTKFHNIKRFICHRAGLFHPNVDGAGAYFEAIKIKLQKIIIV